MQTYDEDAAIKVLTVALKAPSLPLTASLNELSLWCERWNYAEIKALWMLKWWQRSSAYDLKERKQKSALWMVAVVIDWINEDCDRVLRFFFFFIEGGPPSDMGAGCRVGTCLICPLSMPIFFCCLGDGLSGGRTRMPLASHEGEDTDRM